MLKKIKEQSGFTVFEIAVSIALFTIIILLTGSIYTISQKAYNKGSYNNELAQNARVSLDRLSREMRQAVEIVTTLPPTDSDPENPPVNEIFFQDGHEPNEIKYLRYYLSNGNLKRSVVVYYFDVEPGTYVLYNSVDGEGDPPNELVIEDRIVGEYFSTLEFWGEDGLTYIRILLEKKEENLNIRTSIFSRN